MTHIMTDLVKAVGMPSRQVEKIWSPKANRLITLRDRANHAVMESPHPRHLEGPETAYRFHVSTWQSWSINDA